jgi:hypothetical protein
MSENPVTLRPGRARLSTAPDAIGSLVIATTIGIERVNAIKTGMTRSPTMTMTSGFKLTRLVASTAPHPYCPWTNARRIGHWRPRTNPALPIPAETPERGLEMQRRCSEKASGFRSAALAPFAAHAPRSATRPPRREAWLRIFVVRCGLPCDPPFGGHSCNGQMIPRFHRAVSAKTALPKTASGAKSERFDASISSRFTPGRDRCAVIRPLCPRSNSESIEPKVPVLPAIQQLV